MSDLAFNLLILALGWLLNGATGSIARRVRNPHRFGDAHHHWTEIGGKPYAFTEEQLKVAHDRACRLSDPRCRWLRASLWVAGLAFLGLLAFSG